MGDRTEFLATKNKDFLPRKDTENTEEKDKTLLLHWEGFVKNVQNIGRVEVVELTQQVLKKINY